MAVLASFGQREEESQEKVVDPRTANQSNPHPSNSGHMYESGDRMSSRRYQPDYDDRGYDDRRPNRRHYRDADYEGDYDFDDYEPPYPPYDDGPYSRRRRSGGDYESRYAPRGARRPSPSRHPGSAESTDAQQQQPRQTANGEDKVNGFSPVFDEVYDVGNILKGYQDADRAPQAPSRSGKVQQGAVLVIDSDDMFDSPSGTATEGKEQRSSQVLVLDSSDLANPKSPSDARSPHENSELKTLHDEVANLRSELSSVIKAYKEAKKSSTASESDQSKAILKIDALESKIAMAEKQIERSHSITSSLTSYTDDDDTGNQRDEASMILVDLSGKPDNDGAEGPGVDPQAKLRPGLLDGTRIISDDRSDCLYRAPSKDESAFESHLRVCSSSDVLEPIPLPSLDVWFRGPVVAEILDKVSVADRWKTPLIVIQNRAQSKDDSVLFSTGKTSIAAHVCRSDVVKNRFGNRIFWLSMRHFLFSPTQKWDALQYNLLDVLAEKIRSRLCPWMTRKLGKNDMTLQDWRFYISDLIHSARFDESQQVHMEPGMTYLHDCLLVLDDVPDISIVSTLGFLGLVTIVTTRRPLKPQLEAFGAVFDIDANCPTGYPPPPPQRTWTQKALENSTICMIRSAICGYSVSAPVIPDEADDSSVDQVGQMTSDKPKPTVSPLLNVPIDPDTDLALKYNSLSSEIKSKLIMLSKLPDSVIVPAALVAKLWGCEYHVALSSIHLLYSLNWITLASPGAGVIIHRIVANFLSRQVAAMGVIGNQTLKDEYTSALLGWLISPVAFSTNRLYRGDWLSYMSLWNQVSDQTKLAVFTELYEKLISSYGDLPEDERKHAIFTIQTGCIIVLKTASSSEAMTWSENWLKRTVDMWISLVAPESRIPDMMSFRRLFAVMLDYGNKSFLMSDLMNMLRHWYSVHRSWDLNDAVYRLHNVELLSFEGAVLGSCYHVMRAREMYNEAVAYLKDCAADVFSVPLMDNISMNEVLLMFKYPVVSDLMNIAAAANEALDAIMRSRKEVLGSEEHPRVVDIIQLCGEVANFASAQNVESRKLLKAAFLMRCMILSENHPLSVVAFEQMGSALDIISKHSSALPYFQKAASLFSNMYGALHPFFLLCLCFYACNLKACKREKEGELFLRLLLQRLKPITTSLVVSDSMSGKAAVTTVSSLAHKILGSAGDPHQAASGNSSATPAGQGAAPAKAPALGLISPNYYLLVALCLSHLLPAATEDDMTRIKHYLTEALHITGVDASISSAPSLVAWSRSIDPWDAAAAGSVLFRLGGLHEDQGSFAKAKKYYSYSIAAFNSVSNDYPLCRVLSMIRLAVCEMNLGSNSDAKKQLNAASLAIEGYNHSSNIDIVKMTSSIGGGVNSTLRTRFCRLIYRTMLWDDLLAPNAATDLSRAVEQLKDMCSHAS
jgi:hypothetical protein